MKLPRTICIEKRKSKHTSNLFGILFLNELSEGLNIIWVVAELLSKWQK